MLSIQTILHPNDFSATSGHALRLASALAASCDASLIIAHVVATPLVLADGIIFTNPEPGHAELLEKLAHTETPEDRYDLIRRLEEGNPAHEILNLAQLCHADLIVMGAHGRRGSGRWFMGSVAEAVLRKATCPVLVMTSPVGVPSPGPDEFQALLVHG